MSRSELPNELDVLLDVVQRLERGGFAYLLTGSLAMNYYAVPRMTRDVDLVVALNLADADKVVALFEPDYYVAREAVTQALATQSLFNVIHRASVIKVDLIVRKSTAYRQLEFERRRRISVERFELWIVSKEDLILSKLVWARGSRSELQLRDVRNLMATGPDLDYLHQWAAELDVAELLEESLRD